MKKILLSLPSLSAVGAAPLAAQAAGAHTFSFNAGAVTDYRYRGISQSRLDPALQGGIDYTDYSFTVAKDFSGFLVSAGVVGIDTKKIDGERAYASPENGKNLGKTALLAGVKYVF